MQQELDRGRWFRRLAGLALVVWPLAAPAAEDAVRPVGRYGALRVTAEHCEGVQVDLWSHRGALLGLLQACEGAIEARGRAAFEATIGHEQRLSFRATLSLGDVVIGPREQLPSREEWLFRGRLTREALAGRLERRERAAPGFEPRTERMALPRQPERLPAFPDAAAWRSWLAQLPGSPSLPPR